MRLSDIMSQAGLAGYAEVALVLFLIAFALVVLGVFRPSNHAAMDAHGRLPLDDDPTGHSQEDSRS